MVIKREGFLPYVSIGNRYVNVAYYLTYHTMLIHKTFKDFFDLKTSIVQLIERAGFLFNLYFIHLMGNQL